MRREEVFKAINDEREYQEKRWGAAFDEKNTPNDWVAYITKHAGMSVTLPLDKAQFRNQMLKVAAIAVAVLERDEYAPRHYDEEK